MSESELQSACETLSPMERRMLQVLALCESGIRLATLLHILKACGWGAASTKSGVLTQALLKPELKRLCDRNLVHGNNASMAFVSINQDCQDFVVQQSVLNGDFPLIADSIDTCRIELDRDLRDRRPPDGPARELRRQARKAFYRGDVAGYRAAMAGLKDKPPALSNLGLLTPFHAELFEQIAIELKPDILIQSVSQCIVAADGSSEAIEAFDAFAHWHDVLSDEMGDAWVHLLVASGDLSELAQLTDAGKSYSTAAAACHAFLTAQYPTAEAGFDELTARLRKTTGKRNVVLPDLLGLLHILLLLRKNDTASRGTLKSLCDAAQSQWQEPLQVIPQIIAAAVNYADSPSATSKTALKSMLAGMPLRAVPLVRAVAAHVGQWYLPEESFTWGDLLDADAALYEELGLVWLAALCEDGAEASSNVKQVDAPTGHLHDQMGTHPMLSWIQQTELWKRKLDSLRQIADGKPISSGPSSSSTGYDERMIWELNAVVRKNDWGAALSPFIQKRTGGTWSKGRPVALERLYQNHSNKTFAFLTVQDRAVCQCIRQSQVSTGYYRYTETVYQIDAEEALSALVGHPLVYTPGNRTQPLDITTRRPQLLIRRNNSGLQLELDPKPLRENNVVLIKDGAQRLVLVTFTNEQMKLAGILDGALDVPKNGEADVLATAKSLSALLSVQSDITFKEGVADSSVKSVASESRPHLHLLPFHAGVRTEFFVQPFGDSGPFFAPGQGGENVFADLLGESVTTRRDLKREAKLAKEIVASCPSLANASDGKLSPAEFSFADEALDMLLEIEPLRENGKLIVHWPQGQSLQLAGSVDAPQLRVRIERDRDWFAASGELVVDESMKLDLLKLMEFVSVSPSRFVQLSDGRFLALTEQLRKRVAELAAYGERKDNTLRFPQIRAAALSDLDEWCTLKADKHWKSCLKRIRDAGDVVADVPTTLNAELRDYQVEGFRWLCRLAHWGAGACLADDMGLGKTVQAIALLLRRGADGPALVIAPTSVCFNWEAELHRFAPTLNPRMFGAGDRDAFVAELGPRDVVITSYGLLHTEAERLQAVHWHTAILDEAQAIKNTLTKRSQAAMSLTADFRMIMTGTPIENHLGELWNLFQFINPGLLGSLEQYSQRFALPIERDQNRDVRQQLKRLVQPFLLRRTKTQVLSELPPRIEVTVPVTLTDEEALLYEAARLRAVKQLTKDADTKGRHVRILAEIMRLRRACCHPTLLLPDCGLPGAKLTAFSETIDELLENRHKALVFSQFVDHLSILRAELDRKRISYQYLEGSTPMRERQRSVEAFQNGEGDVFLISLKAGGTGLNLTAADYVLHMDPWWNPAVEDQAADRAHRLGQLRPVTIYRFITRGTIEDKILELHATKRDLADSLLEGTDTTGRLSAEELLALMR